MKVSAYGQDCGRPQRSGIKRALVPRRLPALLFMLVLPVTAFSQSTDQNYIMTRRPQVKVTTQAALEAISSDKDKVQAQIQYFDGLGRPLQTVQRQGSPSGNDIVQPFEYDAFGREVKQYLPYTAGGTPGSYRAGALGSSSAQQAYYQSPPAGVTQIPSGAYAETVFEPSPLGRVTEQGAPGAAWQPGTGHTVRTAYGTNTAGEVTLWRVTATGATSSTYAAGTLYKTTTTDENGNAAVEYKDLQDKVVSKKVQSGPSAWLTTDYIYDDLDNLRYVVPPLPPEVSPPSAFSETDPVFENFLYGYRYDGRRRLTEKKLPGKGREYLVYNQLDQVVLSQDALQRQNGIWLFAKYDALGRPVMSGEVPLSADRQTAQDQVDAFSGPLWESFTGENTHYGYSSQSYPQAYGKVHTVNYYDRYEFLDIAGLNPNAAVFTAPSPQTDTIYQEPIGLQTGSLVNVTGTESYLLAVSHYDLDGREVKTIRQHWQGGATGPDKYDLTESRYRFTGELLESTRRHYNTPGHQLTQALLCHYDHMGRRRQVKQQLTGSDGNTLSQAVASRYDYNETGQLYKKYLHSPDYAAAGIAPEGSFLYPQTYSYNARGWLREISSGEFSQTLNYESGGRYNGDITSQYWTIGGTGKTFSYSYDALSRLTSGTSPDMNETGISYDPLGNILSLSRDGQTISYDYVYGGSRGNRLASVSGSYFGETKYYAYDENGNMTRDDSRGISSVSYDHLNLPRQVSSTTGTLLSYHYTATGEKLRSYNSHTGTTTDYVSGIQYENDELKVILTEEGQARRSGDSYSYEYWVKDHLGNTRVAFYRNPSTGQLEVLQREDYYPFGKNRPVGMQSSNKTNYLYNGKEVQEGVGTLDYGARFYDPLTGRFTTVDPLADQENQEGWAPYHYGFNNPIKHIDPDGRNPIVIPFLPTIGEALATAGAAVATYVGIRAIDQRIKNAQANTSTSYRPDNRPLAPSEAQRAHMEARLESSGTPPNPNGAKGKADHQEKVKELAEKAQAENPGKEVVQEKKIKVEGSNRRPDVQVVDPETGRTTKVYEAERKPNSQRNIKREEEYKDLNIPNETHKVGN